MSDWLGLAWVKWTAAALILVAVAGGAAYAMHSHDQVKYDALKTEYDTFKGGVAALGEQAKAAAALQALNDLKKRERADDENKRTHTADVNTILRLRAQLDSARGSYVPAASTGAARPDLACFDRAALESALRELVTEVRGFVDEGAAATVDLNTAKLWEQGRGK